MSEAALPVPARSRTVKTETRREFEVRWYQRFGQYPKYRIIREYSGAGAEYVIGDQSWNRSDRPAEFIETEMELAWLRRLAR